MSVRVILKSVLFAGIALLLGCGEGRQQQSSSEGRYASYMPYLLTKGSDILAIHMVNSRAPSQPDSHIVIDRDDSGGGNFQVLSIFYSGDYNAYNYQITNHHAFALLYQKSGKLYKVYMHDVEKPVTEQLSNTSSVNRASTCITYSAFDYNNRANARFIYQLKQDCKISQDAGAWYMTTMAMNQNDTPQLLPNRIKNIIQSIHNAQTGALEYWLVEEKNSISQNLELVRYDINFTNNKPLPLPDDSGLADVRFIGRTHTKNYALYLGFASGKKGFYLYNPFQNSLSTLWEDSDPSKIYIFQNNKMVGGLNPNSNESCQAKTFTLDHSNMFVVSYSTQAGNTGYDLHRIALDETQGHKILAHENKSISGVWKLRNNVAYTLSDYITYKGQQVQLYKEVKSVLADGLLSNQTLVKLPPNVENTFDAVSDDIACVHASPDNVYIDLRIKRNGNIQRAVYVLPQNGNGYTITGINAFDPYRKLVGYTTSSTYDPVTGYNTHYLIFSEKANASDSSELLRAYDAASGVLFMDMGSTTLLNAFDQTIFHFYSIGHPYGLFTAYRSVGVADIFYFNSENPDSIISVSHDDKEKRSVSH